MSLVRVNIIIVAEGLIGLAIALVIIGALLYANADTRQGGEMLITIAFLVVLAILFLAVAPFLAKWGSAALEWTPKGSRR